MILSSAHLLAVVRKELEGVFVCQMHCLLIGLEDAYRMN